MLEKVDFTNHHWNVVLKVDSKTWGDVKVLLN